MINNTIANLLTNGLRVTGVGPRGDISPWKCVGTKEVDKARRRKSRKKEKKTLLNPASGGSDNYKQVLTV